MKTRYRYKADVPYSLHDMRIEKMKVMDHSLKLFFEHGFIQSKKPYKQVDGTILLEKINLDFCFVYLLLIKSFILYIPLFLFTIYLAAITAPLAKTVLE